MERMYGHFNEDSGEWQKGELETILRDTKHDDTMNYIIMYGQWNPYIMEEFNMLLDDNKLLILANGERLPLLPNTKIFFVGTNVDNLSPATVSRMGCVCDM